MTQIPPAGTRRQLGKMAAVVVAIIATGSAYLAMVDFAIDVIGMLPGVAYTTAGVFELSLITVALLAMEAAQQNRPNGTLLTLTWLLSSASGVFAAWHELYLGHPLGGALWRLIVPLLAATMWHLALIGDRHLASGRTWSSMRENARMHALFLTTDALRRAISADDGSWAARRRVARAQKRRLRARAVALRTVPPTDMRRQTAIWSEALAAADELTSEVVTLADGDAARMTIRVDLSERGERAERASEAETARTEIGSSVHVLAIENERAERPSEQAYPAQHAPETAPEPLASEPIEQAGESAEHEAERPVPSASSETSERPAERIEQPAPLANDAIEQAERASAAAPSARPSEPLVPLVPRTASERRSTRTTQRGRVLTEDELMRHDLMRADGAKVEEIAAALGFRDRNAMYRALQRTTGETTRTPAYGTPQAPKQATIDPFDYPPAYAEAAPGNQRNDY